MFGYYKTLIKEDFQQCIIIRKVLKTHLTCRYKKPLTELHSILIIIKVRVFYTYNVNFILVFYKNVSKQKTDSFFTDVRESIEPGHKTSL